MEMTVEGTFYPSALLTSGWWNKKSAALRKIRWRDGIQEWLFRGFEEWAPSWDFTWDWENRGPAQTPYVVAQLAEGDEANSIPVILPLSRAKWIGERFDKWGGVQAKVTGLLGHRTHFNSGLDEATLEFSAVCSTTACGSTRTTSATASSRWTATPSSTRGTCGSASVREACWSTALPG
jgi:hypothetical protein